MLRFLLFSWLASLGMVSAVEAQVGPLNLPADIERRRLELASDPYRPLYHFVAPEFILKNPNGLLYWKGRYHLF
jgi:sucrose-6-phosphate hydrolase SacC (GH32 family)